MFIRIEVCSLWPEANDCSQAGESFINYLWLCKVRKVQIHLQL